MLRHRAVYRDDCAAVLVLLLVLGDLVGGLRAVRKTAENLRYLIRGEVTT